MAEDSDVHVLEEAGTVWGRFVEVADECCAGVGYGPGLNNSVPLRSGQLETGQSRVLSGLCYLPSSDS